MGGRESSCDAWSRWANFLLSHLDFIRVDVVAIVIIHAVVATSQSIIPARLETQLFSVIYILQLRLGNKRLQRQNHREIYNLDIAGTFISVDDFLVWSRSSQKL